MRLGASFDAVIVADAIDYMLTEPDLAAAFATAHAHLRPGGVFCTYAEHTREHFVQNSNSMGTGAWETPSSPSRTTPTTQTPPTRRSRAPLSTLSVSSAGSALRPTATCWACSISRPGGVCLPPLGLSSLRHSSTKRTSCLSLCSSAASLHRGAKLAGRRPKWQHGCRLQAEPAREGVCQS